MNVAHKTAVEVRTKELKGFDDVTYKLLAKNDRAIIKAYDRAIQNIDMQLEELIRQDQDVSQMFNSIESVKGIGRITALSLICYTNAFTSFETPRQLASYSGGGSL